VDTHGARLFEVGLRVDDSGGKRGWSNAPFGRVARIPAKLAVQYVSISLLTLPYLPMQLDLSTDVSSFYETQVIHEVHGLISNP
jgi:hypothetical protein